MSLTRRRFVALAGASLAGLGLAPAPARAANGPLRVRDLYERDMSFLALAEEMAGTRIVVQGYMAPPLLAESSFFVLTRRPMAVCPFCETEADWPDDILAVYTKRTVDVIRFSVRLATSGRLELGSFRDPDTGFLSRARLVDATYERS